MSQLMTVVLSRADRERRQRTKAYQLYLADLLAEAKTHEELVLLIARLKTDKRTKILRVANKISKKQEIK